MSAEKKKVGRTIEAIDKDLKLKQNRLVKESDRWERLEIKLNIDELLDERLDAAANAKPDATS